MMDFGVSDFPKKGTTTGNLSCTSGVASVYGKAVPVEVRKIDHICCSACASKSRYKISSERNFFRKSYSFKRVAGCGHFKTYLY